jgi:hypothetical protein
MTDGKGTPSFTREKVSIDHVHAALAKSPDWKTLQAFVKFLELLDPTKFEIFLENEQGRSSGRHGYRVVHFAEKIEEKWHDTFSTWFGLGAWMS